ncbi:MFS general substrate transporter, partial [Hortaea werneckii]
MASSDDPWARTQSPTGSQRRKLSFQPTGEWFPPAVHEQEPLGAEPVSKSKRIAQVACAVVYCLLAAGTVFGFAALKPVLVEEGVYRETCTPDELEEGVYTCYEQELRLNLIFTVAAVSTNVCALPVGTVLDRYGPKVASVVGVVNLTIGALAMAFADYLPFDAYVVGYLFLALGGPFVFISSFQLSNTFPQHSGLILALLTGAFDTSSA